MSPWSSVESSPTTRIRILLADDSPTVSAGIQRLLTPEFDVVGSVADGLSLLSAAKKLKPDVLIVDIMMPGLSGLEAIRRLQKRRTGGKAILLSVLCDPAIVEEARAAGAMGYVLKASADKDLINAIHAVQAGNFYLSPALRRSPD